jgi:hypothetical protein
MTTLEIVNGILRNCGETTVADLVSLSGVQLVVWDKLLEALGEICSDQNTRLEFLEKDGAIPLTTGNNKYLISGLASGADMQQEDGESFVALDFDRRIKYITPQEFDTKYSSAVDSGLPTEYTKYAGYIVFNKKATSTENGKSITFRYWKHPTAPSISTPSVALDIPAPFDRNLLVALATLKVLAYLGSDEAVVYKLTVYGDGRDVEGSLAKLKEIYSSPKIKPRVTYHF